MNINFTNYKNLNISQTNELLKLRNAFYVRNSSFNAKFIEINEHLLWLKNLKNAEYFAVFLENKIIGGLNYNLNENLPIWGLFFDENANPFVKSACAYEFIEYIFLKFHTIYAFVKISNTNSAKFTQNFGFKKVDFQNNMLKFELKKEIWEEKKEQNLLKAVKKFSKNIKFSGEIYG